MLHDANAVRPDRALSEILIPFPLARTRPSLMRRGDEVVIRHDGETTIYASPAALAAVMRDHDPVLQARLVEIDGYVDRARQLVTAAEEREREVRALEISAGARITQAAIAEANLRSFASKLKLAAFAGGVLALFAVVFGA